MSKTYLDERVARALLFFYALCALVLMGSLAWAEEPDAITRQIGIEMLRDHINSINRQPPGYWGVGYDVRIG